MALHETLYLLLFIPFQADKLFFYVNINGSVNDNCSADSSFFIENIDYYNAFCPLGLTCHDELADFKDDNNTFFHL